MKKRLLLIILAVGFSIAPAVLADSVGPINRSTEASQAGASACSAGMHVKQFADTGSDSKDDGGRKSNTDAGTAY